MKKFRKGQTVFWNATYIRDVSKKDLENYHELDIGNSFVITHGSSFRPNVTRKQLAEFWNHSNGCIGLAENNPAFEKLCDLLGVR